VPEVAASPEHVGVEPSHCVVVKLLITVLATIVLLLYVQTLGHLADVAADATPPRGDLSELQEPFPVLHADVALVLLLVATTLAVYKPRGLTRCAWRKQRAERAVSKP
jgi:hypothetical protein